MTTSPRPTKMGERTKRNTLEMLTYCKAPSFVVFDRESTHFQPNDHYGKIIELSAVKIMDGKIVDSFDSLVNPEIKISKKITELTGITNEMVANAPTTQQVVQKFVQFCDGSVVVAHNARPDINFVNYFSSKIGMPFEPKFIDTINLCKWIDEKEKVVHEEGHRYNLKEMAEKYGIQNENHHRAMNDTVVTAHLFLKLQSILRPVLDTLDCQIELEEQTDATDAFIGSVNYWEKDINNRLYQRIYVRLILDDKTNDVYYDFTTKSWGIKKSEFKMPDFAFMTEKLKHFMRVSNTDDVYAVTTYRKG